MQAGYQGFQASVASSCAASHADYFQQNMNHANILSSPSCRGNSSSAPPCTAATPKADYPPTFTKEEESLLIKYNGCLKCHKPFFYQKGSNKDPSCFFSIGMAYKPVTTTMIAVAMPASYTFKVTLVMPVNDDT